MIETLAYTFKLIGIATFMYVSIASQAFRGFMFLMLAIYFVFNAFPPGV